MEVLTREKRRHRSGVEFFFRKDLGDYGGWDRVKAMREECRLEALRLNAEGLLFIDEDTIPPFDVIQRLVASDGDMITGIYLGSPPPHYPVVWKYDDPYQDFLRKEDISEIDGAGLGCCLIHRKVLETCTFDVDDQWEDISFWKQAKEKGYKCLSVNNVLCDHLINPTKTVTPGLGGYQIRCPDGVTINGHRYTGRIYEDIEAVMKVDEPYRTGKVKASTSVGGGYSPHERSKNQ